MSSFTQHQKPWKKELQYKPTRNRKVKKSDMCVDAYVNLESHTSLDIDPFSMITGKNGEDGIYFERTDDARKKIADVSVALEKSLARKRRGAITFRETG